MAEKSALKQQNGSRKMSLEPFLILLVAFYVSFSLIYRFPPMPVPDNEDVETVVHIGVNGQENQEKLRFRESLKLEAAFLIFLALLAFLLEQFCHEIGKGISYRPGVSLGLSVGCLTIPLVFGAKIASVHAIDRAGEDSLLGWFWCSSAFSFTILLRSLIVSLFSIREERNVRHVSSILKQGDAKRKSKRESPRFEQGTSKPTSTLFEHSVKDRNLRRRAHSRSKSQPVNISLINPPQERLHNDPSSDIFLLDYGVEKQKREVEKKEEEVVVESPQPFSMKRSIIVLLNSGHFPLGIGALIVCFIASVTVGNILAADVLHYATEFNMPFHPFGLSINLVPLLFVYAACTFFHILLSIALRQLPKTFTLGEAVTICTIIAMIFIDFFGFVLHRSGGFWIFGNINGQMIDVEPTQLSFTLQVYIVCIGAVLGVLFIGVVLFPLLIRIERESHERGSWTNTRNALTITFYLGTILIIAVLIDPLITWILGSDPFLWVFRVILETPIINLSLFVWWIFSFLSSFLIVSKIEIGKYVPQVIQRKLYHALVVAMFVPGIVFSPYVLAIALSLAVSVFIYTEFIRISKAPPIGRAIDDFMQEFTDDRDSGTLISTHIYLLLGCAIPLWLELQRPDIMSMFMGYKFSAHVTSNLSKKLVGRSLISRGGKGIGMLGLAPYSGILSLGVGDSVASAVGYSFGFTFWKGFSQSKTLEGTVAGIVALVFSGAALACSVPPYTCFYWDFGSYLGFFAAATLSMLFESSTEQIDNLFLPLFYYTLLTLAF